MKRLLLLLLLVTTLAARTLYYVETTGVVSLSATGLKATLQMPASAAKTTQGWYVSVYCSVACTATHSVNGTAATTTAGTLNCASGVGCGAASAKFFTASNVGAGTTLFADLVPAGSTFTWNLSNTIWSAAGTAQNYTVAVGSITGDAKITFGHGEVQ